LAEILNIPAGTVAQVVGALTAVGAIFTGVINFAEDKGVIPSLLKATASSGENPITNDPVV